MKIVAKFKRNKDGTYKAWCPSLPGCCATGSDEMEVKKKIEKAVHFYLASLDVHASKEEICELIQA